MKPSVNGPVGGACEHHGDDFREAIGDDGGQCRPCLGAVLDIFEPGGAACGDGAGKEQGIEGRGEQGFQYRRPGEGQALGTPIVMQMRMRSLADRGKSVLVSKRSAGGAGGAELCIDDAEVCMEGVNL